MSNAWLCVVCNVPRLVADLHRKITPCAHKTGSVLQLPDMQPPARTQENAHPAPTSECGLCVSATATELRLQAGAFPMRKSPAPLGLLHNCQRPSLSLASLLNLNGTLALLQASGCLLRRCSAGASLFTFNVFIYKATAVI